MSQTSMNRMNIILSISSSRTPKSTRRFFRTWYLSRLFSVLAHRFDLISVQALEEEQLGRERSSESEAEVLRKANLLVTKTLFR